MDAVPDKEKSELISSFSYTIGVPNLTLGEKNMALLLLRRLTLGDKLILLISCPYCKEKMTQVVSISKLVRSESSSFNPVNNLLSKTLDDFSARTIF